MARWTKSEKEKLGFSEFGEIKSVREHAFVESSVNGDIGELYARHFLENMYKRNPDIASVEIKDVSQERKYQAQGIDLLVDFYKVNDPQQYRTLIEVKNDSYITNNLFVETSSNANLGTKGCIYTSKAHFWLYIYENQDRAILFKPTEVIDYLDKTEKDYRKVAFNNKGFATVEDYKTYGVLVPVLDIVNFIPSAREVRIPIRAMANELGLDMERFKKFKPYRSLIDGRRVYKPYPLDVHATASRILI